MARIQALLWIVAVVAICPASLGAADEEPAFRLSPPDQDGPIEVLVDFQLHNINGINGKSETFEFTGALTLRWVDPREAFDPEVAGVEEKFFQGQYQFNEVATGWYPQVVLVNEGGTYLRSGVQLRIKPDGTSVVTEKITAVAEVNFDMRPFPFDAHRLEAVFAVLGHDSDEVVLRADPGGVDVMRQVLVPEWTLHGYSLTARRLPQEDAAGSAVSSVAVLGIDVTREAVYTRRIITLPMAIIVLLSFSIFWMDMSSLGDRNSISFIGILTGVAYQHIVVDRVPPVSYFTFMHGFLFLSFLIMSATVPINLLVSNMDKKGKTDVGDRIDRRCRWIFPLVYFGSIVLLGVLTGLL